MFIKDVTIFDGLNFIENKNVFIKHDKISHILDNNLQHESRGEDVVINGHGHILAPGFIDLQVNGGGGLFFNDAPHVDTLKKIRDLHLQYGTTSFLPTFISDDFNKLKLALSSVQEAIEKKIHGVLGLHLEGPYLNQEKNGIHNKNSIRMISAHEVEEICEFPLDIKLVTLAPELIPSHFIEKLCKNNILVFAGHTNATFAQMQEAFQRGVSGITHLFNACSQFLSRAPGVVGAGLFYDEIWCGLIADGLHVSYESIKIAFKSKGTHHFILVSDAMAPVGTNLSEFNIHGQKIFVQKKQNSACASQLPVAYQDENGTLAGSALTLHQAVKNIVQQGCASLTQALAMASTNAAQCLQLAHKKGKVCQGYDADLVLLHKEDLDLLHIIQNGVMIK